MLKTIRTFIAVEIPRNIISKIHELQEELKAYGFNIRWVRPENIHLTLKFLGDIEAAKINEIGEAISRTAKGYAPIPLKAKGVGVFPGIKNPRVVWVGLTGQHNFLAMLQKTLDENLKVIGFPEEKRHFKGHLTMGRIKAKIDAKRFGEALMASMRFESDAFTVDQLILFQSELKPSGAVYTKLTSASLG